MMVSFQKSSHGLALQRRSGRGDQLVTSKCGTKPICKRYVVKRDSLATLVVITALVLAANAATRPTPLEFVEEHYKRYAESCRGSSPTPVAVNKDFDPFSGFWESTTIDSVIWTFHIHRSKSYNANFTNNIPKNPRQNPILLEALCNVGGKSDKIFLAKFESITVLCVEQKKHYWMITPQRDQTLFIWSTMKGNGHVYRQRYDGSLSKEMLLLQQDMTNKVGPNSHSKTVRRQHRRTQAPRNPVQQDFYQRIAAAAKSQDETKCDNQQLEQPPQLMPGMVSGSENGSDGDTRSDSQGNASDPVPEPEVPASDRNCWFHLNCRKGKWFVDPVKRKAERHKKFDMSKFTHREQLAGKYQASVTNGHEQVCFGCKKPKPQCYYYANVQQHSRQLGGGKKYYEVDISYKA